MISLSKGISWLVVALCVSVECTGFDGSCCQQGCINTEAGIRCVCRRGFKLVNRCHCTGKLWLLQTFKTLYVVLSENIVGPGLLHWMKVHKWPVSAQDAYIKLSSQCNSTQEKIQMPSWICPQVPKSNKGRSWRLKYFADNFFNFLWSTDKEETNS